MQAANLLSEIGDRWQLFIDIALVVGFGGIHIAAWASPTNASGYKEAAQNGMRAAATGGLTVAGILIPLSILTIGLSTQQGSVELPSSVLVDFFVSNVWLLCSLLLGLYVLFVAGVKGYTTNILEYDTVGWAFGLQLIFLGVGVLRLVWGMSALVNTLIYEDSWRDSRFRTLWANLESFSRWSLPGVTAAWRTTETPRSD